MATTLRSPSTLSERLPGELQNLCGGLEESMTQPGLYETPGHLPTYGEATECSRLTNPPLSSQSAKNAVTRFAPQPQPGVEDNYAGLIAPVPNTSVGPVLVRLQCTNHASVAASRVPPTAQPQPGTKKEVNICINLADLKPKEPAGKFVVVEGTTRQAENSVLTRVESLEISLPVVDKKVKQKFKVYQKWLKEQQNDVQAHHTADCRQLVRRAAKGDTAALKDYKLLVERAYMTKKRTEATIYKEWHTEEGKLFNKYAERVLQMALRTNKGDMEVASKELESQRHVMKSKQDIQIAFLTEKMDAAIRQCIA